MMRHPRHTPYPSNQKLNGCLLTAKCLGRLACTRIEVGHVGHFFIENDRWWSVIGRLAASIFFIGYAQTRIVPLYWIWLGIILSLLES